MAHRCKRIDSSFVRTSWSLEVPYPCCEDYLGSQKIPPVLNVLRARQPAYCQRTDTIWCTSVENAVCHDSLDDTATHVPIALLRSMAWDPHVSAEHSESGCVLRLFQANVGLLRFADNFYAQMYIVILGLRIWAYYCEHIHQLHGHQLVTGEPNRDPDLSV
jgi:hypothetical protein